MSFGDTFFAINSVVPTNTETNILNFTNNTGGDIVLSAIDGTSTTRSEWFIYFDDILEIKRRNSTTKLNVPIDLHNIILESSSNLKVNVKHYITGNQEFSATLIFQNV